MDSFELVGDRGGTKAGLSESSFNPAWVDEPGLVQFKEGVPRIISIEQTQLDR